MTPLGEYSRRLAMSKCKRKFSVIMNNSNMTEIFVKARGRTAACHKTVGMRPKKAISSKVIISINECI